jgi:DNA modification methylase
LLSKSPKYYFDYEAIQEESVCKDDPRAGLGHIDYDGKRGGNQTSLGQQSFVSISEKRNKRDVWSVIPSHYKEAHFATFPEELVTPMLLAGCPKNGVVLDPFMGSGTTGAVAILNKRHYIGCELNKAYIEMANKRIADAVKIANQVTFDDLFSDNQTTFDDIMKGEN